MIWIIKKLVINSYEVRVIEKKYKLLSMKVSLIGISPIYFDNLNTWSACLYILLDFYSTV